MEGLSIESHTLQKLDLETEVQSLNNLKRELYSRFRPPYKRRFIRKVLFMMAKKKQIKIISYNGGNPTTVHKGRAFSLDCLGLDKKAKQFLDFCEVGSVYIRFSVEFDSFPCLERIFRFSSDYDLTRIRRAGRKLMNSCQNEYLSRLRFFEQKSFDGKMMKIAENLHSEEVEYPKEWSRSFYHKICYRNESKNLVEKPEEDSKFWKTKDYPFLYIEKGYRNDKDVLKECIVQHGRHGSHTLYYANEELLEDKEWIADISRVDARCLCFCNSLTEDRSFVLERILDLKENWEYVFCDIGSKLKEDKELVLEILRNNPLSIEHLNYSTLLKDREVILEAVRCDGAAISYLPDLSLPTSEEFDMKVYTEDPEIVLTALENLIEDKEVGDCMEDLLDIFNHVIDENSSLRLDKNIFKQCLRICMERKRRRVDPDLLDHFKDLVTSDSFLTILRSRSYGDLEGTYELFNKAYVDLKKKEISSEETQKKIREFEVNEWREFFLKWLGDTAVDNRQMLWNIDLLLQFDPGEIAKRSEEMVSFFNEEKKKNFAEIIYQKRVLQQQSIGLKDFRFHRRLGSGAYATAYLCSLKLKPIIDRSNNSLELFVIKIYYPRSIIDGNPLTKRKEEEMSKRDSLYLDSLHPSVVSILCDKTSEKIKVKDLQLPDYDDNWRPYHVNKIRGTMIIMKYHRYKLDDFLKLRSGPGNEKFRSIYNQIYVDEEEILIALIILHRILLGVCHLHKNMIVHRDLHPGNIFIYPKEGRVLIGDFGCCLNLSNSPTGFKVHKDHPILFSYNIKKKKGEFNKGGADEFLPPEILNFDKNNGVEQFLDYEKCDVYAVGKLGMACFLPYLKQRLQDTLSSVDQNNEQNLFSVNFLKNEVIPLWNGLSETFVNRPPVLVATTWSHLVGNKLYEHLVKTKSVSKQKEDYTILLEGHNRHKGYAFSEGGKSLDVKQIEI